MPREDEGRARHPATATTTIDSSTKEAKAMIAEPTDKIDRTVVPSPFNISFADARALARVHGSRCDCHPTLRPPAQHQSRGAA